MRDEDEGIDQIITTFTEIYKRVDEYVDKVRRSLGATVEHAHSFYADLERFTSTQLTESKSRDSLKSTVKLLPYTPATLNTTNTAFESTRTRRRNANNNNNNTTLTCNDTTINHGSSNNSISSSKANFFYQHLKRSWTEEAEIKEQREFDQS